MRNSNLISKRIIFVIISAVIIYSIFLFILDGQLIYEKLQSFQLEYIPIVLTMVISGWVVLFVRWNILLKNQKIDIPIKENILIYLAGFSLAISPLKSGELLKSELLRNKFDIPRTKTVPIILMERFYDIIGTVLIAVIIGGFFLGISFVPIILGIAVLTVGVFFMLYFKSVFNFITSKFYRFKFFGKFEEPLKNSQQIFHDSSSKKLVITSTALTVIWRFVEGVGIYFVLIGFGINIIGYLEIISLYSTSVILGAVSMLPAGIGVTEGSFGGLSTLLGMEISIALALAIIIRLFTLWFGVVVGFICLKLSKSL